MILLLAFLLMQAPQQTPLPTAQQPRPQQQPPSGQLPPGSRPVGPYGAIPAPAHPIVLIPAVNGKCGTHEVKLVAEDKTVWCLRP